VPKITVVTPTYNRANLLQRAIKCILEQTFEDWEYIIIDDGSNDGTEEVVKQRADERIQYIKFDQNRGANAARNRGIQEARGEFVSFLDSDDILETNHLEQVVSVLDSSEGKIGGVYTSHRRVGSDNIVHLNIANNILNHPNQVIEDYSVGGFSVLTFRRSVFDKVGILDTDFQAFQDREFLIRFLDYYELSPVEDILVTCHMQQEGLSNNATQKLGSLDELIMKHGNRFSNKGWSHIWYTRGFLYMYQGDVSESNACFRRSLSHDYTNWLALFQMLLSLFGQHTFYTGNQLKSLFRNKILVPIIQYLNR